MKILSDMLTDLLIKRNQFYIWLWNIVKEVIWQHILQKLKKKDTQFLNKTINGCIEENYIWKVCYQLTLALKACHSTQKNGRAVLHRDLKPANIFLDSKMNVKLGDFGLARVLNHENSFARTCVGTPLYMSPEQMSGEAYNAKSDVWALGCLLYELCSLIPPFIASNQIELATKICTGQFHRIPPTYSNRLHHFISNLLIRDPTIRPSIDELLSDSTLLKLNGFYFLESDAIINSNIYEKEISKLRQELEKSKEEIIKLKNELETKNNEYQHKLSKLTERESRIVLLEKTSFERLNRAEKLLDELGRSNLDLTNNEYDACLQHPKLNRCATSICTCSRISTSPSKPPKCPVNNIDKGMGRHNSTLIVQPEYSKDISPNVPKLHRCSSDVKLGSVALKSMVASISPSIMDRKRTSSTSRLSTEDARIIEKRSRRSPSCDNRVKRSDSFRQKTDTYNTQPHNIIPKKKKVPTATLR